MTRNLPHATRAVAAKRVTAALVGIGMGLAPRTAQVLVLDRRRLARLAAALVAGGLATACSQPAPPPQRPRAMTRTTAIPVMRALPVSLVPSRPSDTTFVVIAGTTTTADDVDPIAAERVTARVSHLVTSTGFTTSWPEGLPTSAELAEARCRGLIVVPSIAQLDVTAAGARTEITCTVTIHVAPWHGTDSGERWEPHVTAMATGSARATTSRAPRQVETAIHDCLEGAVEAVTARRLVPFLISARG